MFCSLAHTPKVRSAHLLECTRLYTQGEHLLVLSSTPFAMEVPGYRVMDAFVEEGQRLRYPFADLLIFTEGTCELFFFLFWQRYSFFCAPLTEFQKDVSVHLRSEEYEEEYSRVVFSIHSAVIFYSITFDTM